MFDQSCDIDWFASKECSLSITSEMGIKGNINTGDQEGVMNRWRSRRIKGGFKAFPEISINGEIFPGSLKAVDAFNMICASLKNDKACIETENE